MSDPRDVFVSDVCRRFYMHVMGTSEVPDLLVDTAVNEVFDATARAEFLDWLGNELGGRDMPRFSFSIVSTLGDLYELLSTIVKDDFVKYCTRDVAKIAPAASGGGGGVVAVSKPAETSSLVDDMPQLEPVLPAPKLPDPPKQEIRKEQEIEIEVEVDDLDFLRGKAICAILALGGGTVDVASKTVSTWSLQTILGFLASFEKR